VQAVVLAVILSRVARISVPHYSAFIFSGIVGWTYVAGTVGAGASSIVDNSALSSRIYFPRAILPLALCASNGFALVVSACIALIVGWSSGAGLGVHNFLLIPAVVLIVVFACGLTLLLSAVHVYFRDTVFFVQALLLIWFYATPVFYPLSLLHGAVHTIILINPLTGAVGLFHAAVIGGGVNIAACALTIGWTLGLLVVAAFLHSKYDRSFADLL
jgi:ABC-type polysaccharide/polyol phosphate export permease